MALEISFSVFNHLTIIFLQIESYIYQFLENVKVLLIKQISIDIFINRPIFAADSWNGSKT